MNCEPNVITYEEDLLFAMRSLREHLRFQTKMLSKDHRRKSGIAAADAMRVVAWVEYWQEEITSAANALKQAEEEADTEKTEPTKEEKQW